MSVSEPHTDHPPRGPLRRSLRTWIAVAVLLVALVGGTAVRADLIREKRWIDHDEFWSYLPATGHLGAFERAAHGGLTGRWVPAGQWKALWQASPFLDFLAVGRDLGRFDVHPPGYFWLLHVWTWLFGVHVRSGPSLNLVFTVLTTLALFGLARRLLQDALAAAFVALIWAIDAVVVGISLIARQYDLVALVTVLFVWLVVVVADRRRRLRWLDYVATAAVTAAGMLTHYQFVLVLLGGAVYLAFRLVRPDVGRLWRLLLCFAAGVAVTILLQPWVFEQFARQRGMREHYSLPRLVAKTKALEATVLPFYGVSQATLWRALRVTHSVAVLTVVLVAIVVIPAAVALALPRSRRFLVDHFRRHGGDLVALYFLVWITGGIALQDLTFQSQPHSMGWRYLAMAWPFLAFLPVLLARLVPGRWHLVLVAAFCALVLLPRTLAAPNPYANAAPVERAALARAPAVVADNPWPGVLPRILWWVPDGTPVYVDSQAGLLRDPRAWLDRLGPRDVYASQPTHGQTGQGTRAVRRAIERRFVVRGVGRQVWKRVTLTRILARR